MIMNLSISSEQRLVVGWSLLNVHKVHELLPWSIRVMDPLDDPWSLWNTRPLTIFTCHHLVFDVKYFPGFRHYFLLRIVRNKLWIYFILFHKGCTTSWRASLSSKACSRSFSLFAVLFFNRHICLIFNFGVGFWSVNSSQVSFLETLRKFIDFINR